MGKTLVLGNDKNVEWINSISNYSFVQMPLFSLGEDGEAKLCQYIIDNVPRDICACVLDIDGIANPELCLTFAMTLRLSIFELKEKALVPIFFVSNTTQEIYHGYKYSPVILTGAVIFEKPDNINEVIELMAPLTAIEYKTAFLNVIKVLPNATEGRHSLANQWGADVLHRIVFGTATNNNLIQKARLSLYFRYTLALTLATNDIQAIIDNSYTIEQGNKIGNINALGKKVLLIDDEADKGWSDVLRDLLIGATFKSICEHAADYETLSENARNEIETGDYDLIFLDLRMNGVEEENVLAPEDFSGMKILKTIKKLNMGTQVIMFTASNKAWNMKALLEAGADGYYIKESPEYSFPYSYSVNNAINLLEETKHCLSVSASMKHIWKSISQIKSIMGSNSLANKYFTGMEVMHGMKYQILISTELDVIWSIINSNNEKRYQLAMLSLYKILEFLCEFFYKNVNGQLCLIDPQYKELLFWDNGLWYKKNQKPPIYRTRKKENGGDALNKKDMESTVSKIHNIMNYCKIDAKNSTYLCIRKLGLERNGYIHAKNSATKQTVFSLDLIDTWMSSIAMISQRL